MTSKPAAPRYSHSGICVADLERSLAFYRNVLGFTQGGELRNAHEHNALLQLEGNVLLHSVFLRCGGLVIELLHFISPAPHGSAALRPLNQFGLTHLSFNVDALDDMITLVQKWGGTVVAGSRSRFSLPGMQGEIIFVQDPDGTRLELVSFPQDPVMA